eukprot:CAMPEP_0118899150 /NCGR_PEP_ID=MMETSP1166-20130328/5833_1 /TAXON_ID=1104430 /ORGANISM="Chrysoreinhardia sp, Strain CCMP3193" /LENGTH=391 /DNA_ID=CAMNT_0006838271 /DNA_START=21 /DNA_END=1196 /DNA_ORIENTATION=-
MIVSMSRLVVVLLVAPGAGAFDGVVLWSEGRSATGTLAQAIQKSGINECNDEEGRPAKEGFQEDLRLSAFSACVKEFRSYGTVFTHIKPRWLWEHGGKWASASSPSSWTSLRTTRELFQALWDAGFTIVVANIRENMLSRDLSAMELDLFRTHGEGSFADDRARFRLAEDRFCTRERGLAQEFEEAQDFWQQGIIDALRLGFQIVTITFDDITSEDACPSVGQVFSLLAKARETKYQGDEFLPPPLVFNDTLCHESTATHTGFSHNGVALEDRVGPNAARCIVTQLQGTASAWMLQDHAGTPAPTYGPTSLFQTDSTAGTTASSPFAALLAMLPCLLLCLTAFTLLWFLVAAYESWSRRRFGDDSIFFESSTRKTLRSILPFASSSKDTIE